MTARPNHSKREFAFVIHASMNYLVVLRKYLDDFLDPHPAIELLTIFNDEFEVAKKLRIKLIVG